MPRAAREGSVLIARLQGDWQRTAEAVWAVEGHFLTLSFSQGPQLIIVKVGVSSNARPWGEGVSQESVFAIEGVTITML